MTQNSEPKVRSPYIQLNLARNRDIIRSLKAQQDAKRNRAERLADFLTKHLGGMAFLVANMVWFAVWIAINLGWIPGVSAFDPFPFGLLTMIVSLEAIGLAIIVLVSQNRSSKVAELREEVDLQVDMLTERELTKLMQIVSAMAAKLEVDLSRDEELQQMLAPAPMGKIEHALEEQVLGNEAQ